MRLAPVFFLLLFSFPGKQLFSQDYAIAPASNKYKTSLGIRKLFMGNNYRLAWETPVAIPLFDIHTEKGGLNITRLGGGAQTKSLRMKDKDSVEWVLRTVDKNIKGVLPGPFRKSFIKVIVQDLISTAHPYGALVVGSLAKALDIKAPEPELFFVADDTAFEEHRKHFSNKICMLEQVAPTKYGEAAIDTDSMLHVISEKHEYKIDDTAYLKARLLDMLIADWDRHKDQYKWGMEQNTFYPVVRDRDQAFFYCDGMILTQVRWVALKYMKNFTKKACGFHQLNKRSWLLDKIILDGLDENTWRHCITSIQQTLTDSILEAAVKKLPAEIFEINGIAMLEILKARRDAMMKPAMEYYGFLLKNKKLNSMSRAKMVELLLKEHPGKK